MVYIRLIKKIKEEMGLMFDVGDIGVVVVNDIVGDQVFLVGSFFYNILHSFIICTVLVDLVPEVPDRGFHLSFEFVRGFFVLKPGFFGAMS